MSIPFIDLRAQYAEIESEIRAGIDGVLAHGRYINGPEIEEFEKQLGAFIGVENVVACSNGTDALLMPLMAYGIGPGDAVFTTPFTFFATAEVISLLGATPVFVDIKPRSFNIDPNKLEEAIAKVKAGGKLNPRGVIPVDLFGLPADYDSIQAIADKHDLFVLEDAAQGLGGLDKDRRAGSFGHVASTSFFPAKPLGCYGDGGAVLTNNNDLAATLKSIREHGQGSNKYDNVRIGLNARMASIQSAILLTKLSRFPDEIEERQRVADRYTEKLKDLVTTPFVPDHCKSVWAQYSILTDKRDDLQSALKQAGIPTMIYYPIPIHLSEAYKSLGHRPGDFPVSENVAKQIISLPMHPYLDNETIDTIVEQIKFALA